MLVLNRPDAVRAEVISSPCDATRLCVCDRRSSSQSRPVPPAAPAVAACLTCDARPVLALRQQRSASPQDNPAPDPDPWPEPAGPSAHTAPATAHRRHRHGTPATARARVPDTQRRRRPAPAQTRPPRSAQPQSA
eukprot:7389366-Prymnesium_polylepis.1